jgi:hypothetical protein
MVVFPIVIYPGRLVTITEHYVLLLGDDGAIGSFLGGGPGALPPSDVGPLFGHEGEDPVCKGVDSLGC